MGKRMKKANASDRAADPFREAETANLRAWMKLTGGQKVNFFEEMIELAYHSGALRPERLALRNQIPSPSTTAQQEGNDRH
jgi:hypothetical protein